MNGHGKKSLVDVPLGSVRAEGGSTARGYNNFTSEYDSSYVKTTRLGECGMSRRDVPGASLPKRVMRDFSKYLTYRLSVRESTLSYAYMYFIFVTQLQQLDETGTSNS